MAFPAVSQQAATPPVGRREVAANKADFDLTKLGLSKQIQALDVKVDNRFNTLDTKIDVKFDTLNTKINTLETKFNTLETNLCFVLRIAEVAMTRRGLLSSLSFAGVAAVGGAVGYVFGSQSSTPLLSGLTDQDRKDIDELRAEAHFRRDYDGHVAEVRQDAELAGTLLVRSASGRVSFFTMGLQQEPLLIVATCTAALGAMGPPLPAGG
ncbi:uncharacterized protein HaLaN_11924 [Haematococcus lacustris]|uniref:Uncharacterized protein n=1 Tax=Haematococcus lacustris TaxID=44745 RepID=A0A699YZI0_HAELA|nr:uncharacterized protein HaLaN_11924 [Haematococcus lacustris]